MRGDSADPNLDPKPGVQGPGGDVPAAREYVVKGVGGNGGGMGRGKMQPGDLPRSRAAAQRYLHELLREISPSKGDSGVSGGEAGTKSITASCL